MDDPPNYALYTWEQLQDALAHIKRESYPTNFAALQREIEERLREPPVLTESQPPTPPIASPTNTLHPSSSSPSGCVAAFGGWLCGVFLGVGVGHLWFMRLAAGLRASGVNPYDHDDWGFGWMGCVIISVAGCSLVGLFIGLGFSKRRS